jgi:endonuclease/exonuclease/phosphatase family metal-dependent hydrolase
MRVMTFNLRCDFLLDFSDRWNYRKDMIYYIVNEYKCDIIGTQEVKGNMFKDLKENMKEYNIIGDPRSKKNSSERNNILILKKHSIEEYRTFWLSKNPNEIGSRVWYSLFPRICTTAVIKLDNDKKVRICNSHLDNLLPKAREYELKKLMEVIERQQEKEELPIILMGDFNDTPESNLIKKFKEGKLSRKKLIPVQDKNKSLYNEVTRDKFKRSEKGVHIDYIFVSEEIEVINAEIIKYNINGKYPSDHYPLMADIKIH